MKKMDRNGAWAVSVFVAVALGSALAFANDGKGPPPAPGNSPAEEGPAAATVSLEKFRQQCQDPRKSEVQRAPQDIKLVCRNHEITWIATAPGEVPLQSVRTVSTAVISDKFRVAEVSKKVEAAPIGGSCQRFLEVIEQYAVEVPLSCEQILDGKASLDDLCVAAIDDSRGKNDVGVQVTPTGRAIDTCANLSISQN